MSKGVKTVIATLAGALAGGLISAGTVGKMAGERNARVQQMSDKHLALLQMMSRWVKKKQEGKNLSTYFEEKGYKKIAIYGMSYAGEALVDELKGTTIEVAYGIDQRADRLYAEVDIVTIDDVLDDVDAIVVTAITFFDEIEENLSEIVKCPIVSLEDVLYEV